MKKIILSLSIVVLLALSASGAYYLGQREAKDVTPQNNEQNAEEVAEQPAEEEQSITYKSRKGVSLEVYQPQSGAKVTSPLMVMGQVPGNWSFEAQFPVLIKDESGATVVQAPATLQGEWMTTAMVPFTVRLQFKPAAGTKGTLVLRKSNASGLPEHDDELIIPISF